MICSKCGKKYGKNDKYCPHCGELAVPYQPSYKRLDEQTKGGIFRPKSYDDVVKRPEPPKEDKPIHKEIPERPIVHPQGQNFDSQKFSAQMFIGIFLGMFILIAITVFLTTSGILDNNPELFAIIFPVIWMSFFFGIPIIVFLINRKK